MKVKKQITKDGKTLVTISEYARMLGVTRQAVWYRVKRRELKIEKINTEVIYIVI